MNSLTVFFQMMVLFAMMVLGYVVRKKNILNKDASARLSSLVVNLFNPILIVNSVLVGADGTTHENMLSNFAMIFLYFAILIVFSILVLVILRPVKPERPMYVLMTVFANIGYIGIPVAKSLYGNEGALYVAFYVLGFNIFLYTFGLFVAERTKSADDTDQESKSFLSKFKKIINPGMIACLIAVVISVFQLEMPAPVISFCDYMGTTTIPLSMIIIGATFADAGIRDTLNDWRAYVFTMLRMVVLPVLAFYATRSLPLNEVVYGVFILELSMPVAAVVTLLVQERGGDSTCCVRGTIITTLASIITVPLVFALTVGW